MKIIFLDIDGVLNSARTQETFRDYVFVSDDKVMLLKELVEQTDAKIVLSSSWREGWALKDKYPKCRHVDVELYEALCDKLAQYDLKLFDYTGKGRMRGLEIDEWLKREHDEKIESFVILDDMDETDFWPHSSHLVQTDISKGLTKKCVEMAIKKLNEN